LSSTPPRELCPYSHAHSLPDDEEWNKEKRERGNEPTIFAKEREERHRIEEREERHRIEEREERQRIEERERETYEVLNHIAMGDEIRKKNISKHDKLRRNQKRKEKEKQESIDKEEKEKSERL
jgi:hypothetical protein